MFNIFNPASFRLNGPVADKRDVDPEDIIHARAALGKLGHLNSGPDALTSFPDQEFFSGVKRFQRQQGLRTDGVMKPGGPTERKINSLLSGGKPESQRQPVTTQLPVPAMPVPVRTQTTDKRRRDRTDSHFDHRQRSANKKLQEKLRQLDQARQSGRTTEVMGHIRDLLTYKRGGLREELNKAQPGTVEEASRTGFRETGPGQAKFHGGNAAIKMVHPDGREVVFDRKTGKKIRNEHRGTFNYRYAAPANLDKMNLLEQAIFGINELDHILLDIIPWYLRIGRADDQDNTPGDFWRRSGHGFDWRRPD